MNVKKMCTVTLAGLFTGLCAFGGTALAHAKSTDETQAVMNSVQHATFQEDAAASAKAEAMSQTEKLQPGIVYAADGSRPMRMLNVKSKDTGGTLIFSDSPEYVNTDGILYRDKVVGDARVLYYHLNNTDVPKKVEVVIEGEPGVDTIVTVTRKGTGRPSSDYMRVGKEAQTKYFDGKNDFLSRIHLLNGHAHVLDVDMDQTYLAPGELVYGIYDFHADHPVTVTVLMCGTDVNPVTVAHTARVLPKDEQRLRGTFPMMNRIISTDRPYDPLRDGTVYIPLADDKHDLYRQGIDATDGSKVTNYGNYGILYFMDIPTTGRMPVSYFLSPLGGSYAGAMSANINNRREERLLQVPSFREYFGDTTPPETDEERTERENGSTFIRDTTELANLGTYRATDDVRFEFSPPGASNLPVNLILSPEK